MSCQTYLDCNNKGYCINNECLCDVAWFGENCNYSLKDYWPNGYSSYRALFLTFYAVLASVVLFRLHNKIKKESQLYMQHRLVVYLKGMTSPFNLIMTLILIICITQILWLSVDPFVYKDIFNRSVERLLYEAAYTLLFIIYAIVLWVWHIIYEELRNRKVQHQKFRLSCFRVAIIFLIVFAIIAQLTTSIMKGFRTEEFRDVVLGVYVLLFMFQMLYILMFSIYGIRLRRLIMDQEKTIIENSIQTLQENLSRCSSVQSNLVRPKLKTSVSSDSQPVSLPVPKGLVRAKSTNHADLYQAQPHILRSYPIHSPVFMLSLQKNSSKATIPLPSLLENIEEEIEEQKPELVARESDLPRATPNRLDQFNKDMEAYKDILRQPRFSRAMTVYKQAIAERDKDCFILEKEDIATFDTEIIIGDMTGYVWNMEEEEHKDKNILKKKEETKDEVMESIQKCRQMKLVQQYAERNVVKEVLDKDNKKLMEDPNYVKYYKDITRSDCEVIKRVTGLTVIAIGLGIIAAILGLIAYLSNALRSPLGVLIFMWITGLFVVFAIISILMLFSVVNSQDKENLRLISRIGKSKNRINKLYAFVLPDYLREEKTKRILEGSINYMTTKHPSFLKSHIETK